MSRSSLIVERVSAVGSHRVALQVVAPEGVDLQFIYRAALSVYWDPSKMRLEDRYEDETSALASFRRIVRALKNEYGLRLQPSENLIWDGLDAADQKAIEGAWIG